MSTIQFKIAIKTLNATNRPSGMITAKTTTITMIWTKRKSRRNSQRMVEKGIMKRIEEDEIIDFDANAEELFN